MRHWWLLSIRNLRTKPGRSAACATAIALGVGTVIWITSSYESIRKSIEEQVVAWIGSSHISIEPPPLSWIEESILEQIRQIENLKVLSPRLRQSVHTFPAANHTDVNAPETGLWVANMIGIDPAVEYQLRTFRSPDRPLNDTPLADYGRLLRSDDEAGCMLEQELANEMGVQVGDTIAIAKAPGSPVTRFKIVGQFILRRVAKFQLPSIIVQLSDLQSLTDRAGQLSVIDLTLKDDSIPAMQQTASELETMLKESSKNYAVQTAEARVRVLLIARDQAEFVLTLISCVALITSFFIVATTMSMSIVERLMQLGIMRCVGVCRWQLFILSLAEIIPLGICGVILGIPVGLALTEFSVRLAPDYMQQFTLSIWGLKMGIGGGLVTALASGLLPAIQAAKLSPMAATRPISNPPRFILAVISAIIGVGCLAGHQIGLAVVPGHLWFDKSIAVSGAFSIYAGYALITPLFIYLSSKTLSFIAATLLKIRPQLLHKQIAASPWRSSVLCCGFMVALALVICVSVHSESVLAGWNFPSQVPETFVWMWEPIPASRLAKVKQVHGVKDVAAVTNFLCYIESTKRSGIALVRIPNSTFVAVDIDPFLRLTRLEYLEGGEKEAIAKMKTGGYVLAPLECAQQLNLSVGSQIPIAYGNKKHTFEVAAIVKSPSLDIASKYFQADQQLLKASANSVIGSLDDVRTHFDVNQLSLFLMNLEMPHASTAVPEFFSLKDPPANKISHEYMAQLLPEWIDLLPQEQSILIRLLPEIQTWNRQLQDWNAAGSVNEPPPAPEDLLPFTRALRDSCRNWYELTPLQRFRRYQEHVILQRVKQTVDRPGAASGSVRQLKEDIDRELRQAMYMINAIPIIGLIVAAIGAGNLMMANVVARFKSIATLRAVGATQWQIVRLVLAEALILGLLGSLVGLALGFHTASSINTVTFVVWGFKTAWTIPWNMVLLAAALTIAACLMAGLIPARYAARSNIIAAMSNT